MLEHIFKCPYCFEEITILIEPQGGAQAYVEDCQVCCRPIAISCEVEGGELTDFEAYAMD